MSKARHGDEVKVIAEGGGWSVVIPGLPVAADGATFDEAIGEMVQALWEYAEDWRNHLRTVPNHHEHRSLVRWVEQSDDQRLADWLAGAAT